MLTHLVIRNFAIIERLEIPFRAGLTVLTGETGAGKSIIIDALNLLLGGRAATEVIRTDEQEAVVEGVFEPDGVIRQVVADRLGDRGIEMEDGQLVVRRIISRTGRNKVFINGSLTTVGALAELTKGLVDISGQHEHYSLLDPEGHVDILDNFADLGAQRAEMSARHSKMAAIERELRAIDRSKRERAGRIDYLRFQLEEIDRAELEAGEDEDLAREIARLRHAEKLQEAAQSALFCSYESDSGASTQLGEAAMAIGRVGEFDEEMAAIGARFDEIAMQLEEAARDLRTHLRSIDRDPRRLHECVERQEMIKRLNRKHGESVEAILAHADQMREELEGLEGAEERSHKLDEELASARTRAFETARALSEARREAASRLEERLEAELADLNMARTRFIVDFSPSMIPSTPHTPREYEGLDAANEDGASDHGAPIEISARGLDRVEFLISPNLGEEPKPLAKIASGGELSRVMLVMKSALMERDVVGTYIFDEVDTGIGGSTADKVGQKIQNTAHNHQVLCITHLPQIASRCEHHYLVEKLQVGDRTQSTIRPLEVEERVEEIARMLGGLHVTTTTIEAAREMITSKIRLAG